jgi:hypothetical protein
VACYQWLVRSPVSPSVTHSDPLLRDFDLPIRRIYHPYGFQVELSSNSADVHHAAAEAWSMYRAAYSDPAITLRIAVQPGDELSPPPVYRAQGHLYTVIGSQQNYGCLDFESRFGYAWITRATAADHPWFRWFYLDGMTGSMLAQQHHVPMHAACVARNGAGVLLFGPSGMGKSTLSYACARAGWTFISDDCTSFPQNHDTREVTGRPQQARFREDAPQLFPEFEGYVTRARPTGKVSIEVPIDTLAGIQTAQHCEVGVLIFLERGESGGLSRLSDEEAMERMLANSGCYGPATFARHERAIRRLLSAPAYRLRYVELEEAISALERLTS